MPCSRGVPGPGGSGLGEGGCLVQGGLLPGGRVGVPGGDPPGRLLLWAVRILLKCILLPESFHKIFEQENYL